MARVDIYKTLWWIKTQIRAKEIIWELNCSKEISYGIEKAACIIEATNGHLNG